jgi:hypothetical protein
MMSPICTNRTCRVGLTMCVPRGRPEVAGRGSNGAVDPSATFAGIACRNVEAAFSPY